jgi:hypothetical protein
VAQPSDLVVPKVVGLVVIVGQQWYNPPVGAVLQNQLPFGIVQSSTRKSVTRSAYRDIGSSARNSGTHKNARGAQGSFGNARTSTRRLIGGLEGDGCLPLESVR